MISTFAAKHAVVATVLAGSLLLATSGAANTSHAGWPKIDGDLKMHKSDRDGVLAAHKLHKHNELLGGHGNDTIRAGRIGDVLWGDYKPSGQPTTQVDRIYGGQGKDFIYASHGTNYIHAGGGADQIHAHFGHGEIWCGGGNVTLFLSHKSRKRYTLHSCERVSYRTLGY
jgi:Ca2+-binding RTX toxin-like protein